MTDKQGLETSQEQGSDTTLSLSSLSSRMHSGTVWATVNQVVNRFIGLVRGVILAHLLLPEDFGLYGLAFVIVAFFVALADAGAGAFLIHKQDESGRYTSAVFWLNIVIALILTSTLVIVAPLVGFFYQDARVVPIILVLAFSFLIQTIASIHLAILRKQFRFRSLAIIGVCMNLVSLLCSILLALEGYGAWSFVLSTLLGNLVNLILLWRASGWIPSLDIELRLWPEVWKFCRSYLASTVVWYVLLNTAHLMIGRHMGAAALGFYSLAYNYAMVVPLTLGYTVGEVMFPSFSVLQSNMSQLRSSFLKSSRLMSYVAFPVTLFLVILAPELFNLVFGSQWEPAVLPFQVLLLFGLTRTLYPDALTPLGRPDLVLRLGLYTLPFLFLGIFIGLNFGVVGVAVGMSLTLGLAPMAFLPYITSYLGIHWFHVVRGFMPAAICSLSSTVIVAVGRMQFLPAGSGLIELLVLSSFWLAGYFLLLHLFFRVEFREFVLTAVTIVRSMVVEPREAA